MMDLEDFDFGFSFVEELPNVETVKEVQVMDYEKVDALRDMIMPLLLNLKNSSGDFIKWPAEMRRERINAFIKQMDELIAAD